MPQILDAWKVQNQDPFLYYKRMHRFLFSCFFFFAFSSKEDYSFKSGIVFLFLRIIEQSFVNCMLIYRSVTKRKTDDCKNGRKATNDNSYR